MAFLKINGWTIPVVNASPARKLEARGRRGRSFRGQMRDSRRYSRQSWNVRAVVQDHEDAHALERLLGGVGHFFDMADGLQGSTGLEPLAGFTTSVRHSPAGWGAYGRGFAYVVTAGSGICLSYDAQLGAEWTVGWQRWTGTEWQGVALRSDGRAYVAGAASLTFGLTATQGGIGIYPRVVGGVVEIWKDLAVAPELIDDLFILPYRASDSMLAAVTVSPATGTKFGACPSIRIEGDLVAGAREIGVADVDAVEILQRPAVVPGYGWVNNAAEVAFRLTTVDPSFTRDAEGETDETPTPPGAPLFWLDGGDVDGMLNTTLSQGDLVAAWTNRGSAGGTAAQATAGNKPTFQRVADRRRLEGNAALRFDGVDDYLVTAAAGSVASPTTIAVVWKTTSIGATTAYVVNRPTGAGFRARVLRSTAAVEVGGDAAASPHTTALVANEWNATIATLKSSGSKHRLNGEEETEASNLSSATGTAGLSVGALDGGASPHVGDVAEVLLWSGEQDLDAIQAYLEARWGSFPG